MSKFGLWFHIIVAAARSGSNQEFYDRIAPIYEQAFVSHRLHIHRIVALLKEHAPVIGRQPGRVLDLGCGTGMLTRVLYESGFNVVGLDLSGGSLDQLHQSNPRIAAVNGVAVRLPFRDSSFQAVVTLGAWRHLAAPQKVLCEVARLLDDGGIMIAGYFPPALGGVLHAHHRMWNKLFVQAYHQLSRYRGFEDRGDLALETETIRQAGSCFERVWTVKSGAHWRLIAACQPSKPNRHLLTPATLHAPASRH